MAAFRILRWFVIILAGWLAGWLVASEPEIVAAFRILKWFVITLACWLADCLLAGSSSLT